MLSSVWEEIGHFNLTPLAVTVGLKQKRAHTVGDVNGSWKGDVGEEDREETWVR